MAERRRNQIRLEELRYAIAFLECPRLYIPYEGNNSGCVRHGLCTKSEDWEVSSIHRFIKQGIYAIDRNPNQNLEAAIEMWDNPK